MKNNLHNAKKKTHPTFKDYDESHHVAKKIKTHAQRKANNAIDKALKRTNLRDLYNMDDY